MRIYEPRMDPALNWLKALLGVHGGRLRAGLRAGDRGASAIELAIITAVLVALAAVILGIIVVFTRKQGQSITDTVVPSP